MVDASVNITHAAFCCARCVDLNDIQSDEFYTIYYVSPACICGHTEFHISGMVDLVQVYGLDIETHIVSVPPR